VTGAWRAGDPPGPRRFVELFRDTPLALDAGGALSHITVAYETFGELNASRSNAVLVLHALTGDSHVAGAPYPGHPLPGWWEEMIGPGLAIDTDRFCVVCPNVLGGCQGTTGPASIDPATGRAYGSRFPKITVRDQVAVEAAVGDALGIEQWVCVIGASMGGQRALEWAATYPERVPRAVVIAANAVASADEIALCGLQIRAITADPNFRGGDYYDAPAGEGPWRGMSVARGIGWVSYRSGAEFDERFGASAQDGEDPLQGGRFAIESYLEYHGEKLSERFDANTYIVLSRVMQLHDVGRGRGGVEAALARVQAHVTLAGVSSDRLYPLQQQEELARLLPRSSGVHVIESDAGHDAFLIEVDAMGKIVESALA
jgi:homoserine O-acetyltransferase/O-succinyltransferase